MTAADRLAQIEARADAATDGPWEYRYLSPYKGGNVYEPSGYPLPGCTNCGDNEATYEEYDAEFIAHARTDVPALVAALRAVLDLHKARDEQVLATDCSAETCDCEDGCQTVPIKVCEHCMDLGDSAHHYAYEEGGIETVIWPCPTVRAVEAALGEVAS